MCVYIYIYVSIYMYTLLLVLVLSSSRTSSGIRVSVSMVIGEDGGRCHASCNDVLAGWPVPPKKPQRVRIYIYIYVYTHICSIISLQYYICIYIYIYIYILPILSTCLLYFQLFRVKFQDVKVKQHSWNAHSNLEQHLEQLIIHLA